MGYTKLDYRSGRGGIMTHYDIRERDQLLHAISWELHTGWRKFQAQKVTGKTRLFDFEDLDDFQLFLFSD
jgi:hypothetical protein